MISGESQMKLLLKFQVKPYFKESSIVSILFDEPMELIEINLKQTDNKRYDNNYKELDLTLNMVVEDWDIILKQKSNKLQFKYMFAKYLLENANIILEEGNKLYLNGIMKNGEVICIFLKNGQLCKHTMNKDWNLCKGESDSKIFFLLEKFLLQGKKNFLIFSKDTDVRVLSIYFSAKHQDSQIVVKSGTSSFPSYFYPSLFVNYMKENFDAENCSMAMAISILRTYSIMGCDQNPGFFYLSHGNGLQVCDDFLREGKLETREDFLELILKIYQNKNKGLERFWHFDPSVPLEVKIMETRRKIKMKNGCENETLPLCSVLKLQVKRSEYLAGKWTKNECTLDPLQFGWNVGKDGCYNVQLQDLDDPYFFLPKHMLMGCQCKKECSKNCGCSKDPHRKGCSEATCKFCACFLRNQLTPQSSKPESDNEVASSDEESVYSEFDEAFLENVVNVHNEDDDFELFN